MSKSSFVRSATKLPLASRTITSVLTSSTCTEKAGFSVPLVCFWPAGDGCWADSPAATITIRPAPKNPRIFMYTTTADYTPPLLWSLVPHDVIFLAFGVSDIGRTDQLHRGRRQLE